MIKKNSYERRVYESVDENSLSKVISQKNDEKNKSCKKRVKQIYKFQFPLTHYAWSLFFFVVFRDIA